MNGSELSGFVARLAYHGQHFTIFLSHSDDSLHATLVIQALLTQPGTHLYTVAVSFNEVLSSITTEFLLLGYSHIPHLHTTDQLEIKSDGNMSGSQGSTKDVVTISVSGETFRLLKLPAPENGNYPAEQGRVIANCATCSLEDFVHLRGNKSMTPGVMQGKKERKKLEKLKICML